MADRRPAIPDPLKRAVLVEAGHRCAIPTCRQHPVDIDHIDEWAKVKEHKFENLIALCPNCHRRKTGKEIDRQAMLQYKRNLSLLNGRYTDIERQLLRAFSKVGLFPVVLEETWADMSDQIAYPGEPLIPEGMEWTISNLIADEMVVVRQAAERREWTVNKKQGLNKVTLTDAGRELVKRWMENEPIE